MSVVLGNHFISGKLSINSHSSEFTLFPELFQHKSNLTQACLQDLEEAIPSELIADLCDEDDELCLSVTPLTLLHHMEELCDMVKPSETMDDIIKWKQISFCGGH